MQGGGQNSPAMQTSSPISTNSNLQIKFLINKEIMYFHRIRVDMLRKTFKSSQAMSKIAQTFFPLMIRTKFCKNQQASKDARLYKS